MTVVIPTYDRPTLVARAIESVLNQTFREFECIVVDDHSPESDTEAYVTSLDSDKVTYVRHEENRGLSAARNTGIERADSEFVAFLDDDDEWLPVKLERQVDLFDALSDDFGLVYCWMDYVTEGGRVKRRYRPTLSGRILPYVLDGQRIGSGSTLLVRTSIARELGGFDESLSRGIDGDFIRRVCREYKVDFVPETLVRYHVGHGHQRITRADAEGIRNAIQGKHTKLRKFPDELERYPRRKANIYAGIAYHHSQLGEWGSSGGYYLKAFDTSLVSWRVYTKLAGSLILLVAALVGNLVGRLRGKLEEPK